MRTIICTTGTSIAGGPPKELGMSEKSYRRHIRKRIAEFKTASSTDESFLRSTSAESNSLYSLDASTDDRIILFHTDTMDGKACAEELALMLENELSIMAEPFVINGLQVDNATEFRRIGIQNLFASLDRICTPEKHRSASTIILNATGGFKSVVPYLTLYGLLNRFDVVYIFERSKTLINLPPAPVSFDLDMLSRARDAIMTLKNELVMERNAFFRMIPNLQWHEKEYFDTLLEEGDDGNVMPSAFAMLLFNTLEENYSSDVYISGSARKSYASSSGITQRQYAFMLERIKDPLYRKAKVHPVGLDLIANKPGNTSERMLYFMEGGSVYVCELATHDEYEKLIDAGRSRKDYNLSEFIRWEPGNNIKDLPTSEIEAYNRIKSSLEEAEKSWEEAESSLAGYKTKLNDALRLIKDIKGKEAELEKEFAEKTAYILSLKNEIDEKDHIIKNLKQELQKGIFNILRKNLNRGWDTILQVVPMLSVGVRNKIKFLKSPKWSQKR